MKFLNPNLVSPYLTQIWFETTQHCLECRCVYVACVFWAGLSGECEVKEKEGASEKGREEEGMRGYREGRWRDAGDIKNADDKEEERVEEWLRHWKQMSETRRKTVSCL